MTSAMVTTAADGESIIASNVTDRLAKSSGPFPIEMFSGDTVIPCNLGSNPAVVPALPPPFRRNVT